MMRCKFFMCGGCELLKHGHGSTVGFRGESLDIIIGEGPYVGNNGFRSGSFVNM